MISVSSDEEPLNMRGKKRSNEDIIQADEGGESEGEDSRYNVSPKKTKDVFSSPSVSAATSVRTRS